MRTMSACQSVALWVSASLFAPSADSSLFLSGVWSPGRQGQGVIFLFYLPDASALSTQKEWEKSFLIRTWLIRWLGAQSPLLLLTSDPPVNISFKALLSWKLAWPDGAKFTRPHAFPHPGMTELPSPSLFQNAAWPWISRELLVWGACPHHLFIWKRTETSKQNDDLLLNGHKLRK
jgi:hypothetical protein